jgi:hypothetical protein
MQPHGVLGAYSKLIRDALEQEPNRNTGLKLASDANDLGCDA